MNLNKEYYRHIIHYNLNVEQLMQEFREKYIGIKSEDFVGSFPSFSDACTTGYYLFQTEKLTLSKGS
ncbi:MAG: hypothetical protein JWQ14_3155 [Adhaeribacter sp.]|nr:hypothetical protein [Adhaeribacter sp.]